MKMTQEELKELMRGVVKEETADLRESQGSQMDQIREAMRREAAATLDDKTKGRGFARLIRALAAGKGDCDRALSYAKRQKADNAWDDDLGELVIRALGTGVGTAGGFFVPDDLSMEIIELLRARAIVRSMNPVMLPMPSGVLTLPKLTGGATAGYIGESTPQNATQQTTGQLRLTWKKLRAHVPVSNEFLKFSIPAADDTIRDDSIAALATREDQAFLRDDGTADTPKGLRYWAPAANVTATAGKTLANVETDLKGLLQTLEGADVRMLRPGWMMSPRSKNHLLTLRETGGALAFPELREGNGDRLWTLPLGVTNNIPSNLGSGSDESEVYLVDFADAVIGEATELEIAVSSEASYTDSGGTVVSAFDRDETVMKLIARHDFGMRHDASIAITTGVQWGT